MTTDQAGAGTRRAAVDVIGPLVMLVAGITLIQIDLVDTWTDAWRPGWNRWWHLAPLVALCVLMAWRRRRPLLCLGLGTGVFLAEGALGGSVASVLVLVEIVYAAALHGRRPMVDRLEWVVGGAVVLSAVAVAVVARDVRAAVIMGLTVFAVFGTSYWWGASTRRQLDLTDAERRRALDQARLAELRESEARRSEREQMARELHDALSGSLSAITIHAEAGLQAPEASQEALRVVRATSREAMGELQQLLAVLRPSADRTTQRREDVVGHVVAAARERGLDVSLVLDPDPLPPLAASVEHAAGRVLQEALHNVGRHAARPEAEVVLASGAADATGTGLRLTVTSPLRDRAVASEGSGLGLRSMDERVRAVGGWLSAGPAGDRWRLEAVIPLTPEGTP